MEKQWALITGASSGIGLAYARELASRGYHLVIVSNEEKAIQETGEHLSGEYGIETFPLYRDLAIPGAAKELYETCKEKGIPVEILINNAGMFFFKETLSERPLIIEKMLCLHVTTPTQLCYFFGQEMKKRRHGFILNMSSLSAWLPYPGIALYASTKCYLKSFSRALRSELIDYGVSVTVLCPGGVSTNLYNLSDNLKSLAIHLGIMMRPETVAKKGVNALLHRQALLIPGLFNKLCTPLVLCLPHGFIRWALRKSKLLETTG